MFKIKNKKTFLSKISMIICFVIFLGFTNISSIDVEAEEFKSQPTFSIQIDPITPNPATVGEDITVKGKIIPQPFESTRQKKQIVLVLDVSGSMQGDKISNLKNAASNFVTKMSSISNVEISIVVFSSEATINPTLFHDGTRYATRKSKSIDQNAYHDIPNYESSGTNFLSLDNGLNVKKIQENISGLEALGGTNAGEGLRRAEYMLENGDESASKSIIFMSDGLPTFYSVQGFNHVGYQTIGNTMPSYAGYGNDQDPNSVKNSIAYATSIGELIRKQNLNLNVFSIGYGLGDVNSDGNLNMQNIHKSMGGTTGDQGTFFASDVSAIDGVFNKIADKIVEKYVVADMNIDLSSALNFDSNFSVISGSKIINIRNVNYKVQPRDDKKIVYIADEIPFEFTIKANQKASYDDIFNGAKLTYPWNGQTLSTDMPNLKMNVNDNTSPIINASIIGQDPNPATRLQNITLECKMNPEKFNINSTIYDKSGPKDIIFVVDTSKSMEDKITSLKNGLYGKIVNNEKITNAKYGIVTFNETIKSDYISDGLSKDISTLDSAIKNISTTSSVNRNVGNALEKAKEIFTSSGRSDSSKYIVLIGSDNLEYTNDQLIDIEKSNFNVITVNLGYLTPPTKVNDTVISGAEEANNNIKNLHYNLIGKGDNKDNILQKAEKSYFLNINYSKVTNLDNPNEFFTKEENSNQMNNGNEINNWILGKVAEKIQNATVKIKTPSYTFKTKLKFTLQGKISSISGFNPCSDTNYDVETPEFDVVYKLNDNGEYVADSIDSKKFTIKIKDGIDIKDLKFGPGVISYNNLSNELSNNTIESYKLNLKSILGINKFGLYEGIKNQEPYIIEDGQPFNQAKGSNVNLGATLTGSISNDTDIKLEIPKEIIVSGDISVSSYDDKGILTPIGKMVQISSDDTKTTYKYSGQDAVDKKILILCNEQMPPKPTNSIYINSLYTDSQRDVKIKVTDELSELF